MLQTLTNKNKITYFAFQPISVEGTFIHFDGALNTGTNTLRVFALYGDTGLFEEGLQNFCIENKINKAII
jgi:hypothetical protein